MIKQINSVEDIKNFKSVSLYGAGSLGAFSKKKIETLLPSLKIDYFVDDIKTGLFQNIEIKKFEEYKNSPSDVLLITSSYWKDISKKVEYTGLKCMVLDFLSGKSELEIVEKIFNSQAIHFYTPNNFLNQVIQNFENIEPQTNKWIDSFEPKSVFYDIGASCGIYSIYASITKNCTSYTFEPDAQNHSIIERNNFLNKQLLSGKLITLNLGLGDKPGIIPLVCQDYTAGSHGKIFHTENRELQANMEADYIQYTLCDSLDDLIKRYKLQIPDYIKIDVDGFEYNVLLGAEKTLLNENIKEVLVETDENQISNIESFFKKLNYKLITKHMINEITGYPVSGVNNYLFVKC